MTIDSLKKKMIKGSFFSLTRAFFQTWFVGLVTLCCLYQLINSDTLGDAGKFEELFGATMGLVALTVIFYWLLTTLYYYYEVTPDKVIVRNWIKPYYRELPLSTLLYVNVCGDITRSKTSSDNSLQFIYQYDDESKNYHFGSVNYDKEDWIVVIKRLKELDVEIRDSNESFFKNSDIKLDDL